MQPTWATKDGRVQLYLGDCLDVLPHLGSRVVVTDPPYGVGLGDTSGQGNSRHGLKRQGYASTCDTYETFVTEIVPRITTALESSVRAAVFTGPHIHEQKKPDCIGGVYFPSACGRHCWGFKNLLPVLLYGVAPRLQFGAKYPTAILSNAKAELSDHPCPKPLQWMEWLVLLASEQSETILDPFMGSGTTGVAAFRTGRKFIGIEIEPEYFWKAVKRIEDELTRHPLLEPPPEVQRSLLDIGSPPGVD